MNGNYNFLTRGIVIIQRTSHLSWITGRHGGGLHHGFFATLRVSKVSSNIIGTFHGKPGYQNTCADVNFNLKFNADISKEDSILTAIKLYKETYQTWKPTYEDTLVAVNIVPRKVVNYVVDEEYKKEKMWSPMRSP